MQPQKFKWGHLVLFFMDILFPHEQMRPVQQDLIHDIHEALKARKNMLAHAPTGLGKTASALSVAVPFALKHGLTVFFLTNRHTQHKIAIDTLKAMKAKHGKAFVVADLIGKKNMCLQDGVEQMYHSDLVEYCKSLREHNTCSFYLKLYRKNSVELSVESSKVHHDMMKKTLAADELKDACSSHGICPYYFASEIAKSADVIVADYYNVFHPSVQKTFFARIGKELEKSIIIVDEAHNVAERIRNVMSRKLSGSMVRYALSEAKKFSPELIAPLQHVQQVLHSLSSGAPKTIAIEDFVSAFSPYDYDELISKFEMVGEQVREASKKSFIGSIAEFLESWKTGDEGYVRYIETYAQEPFVSLHLSCLDSAVVSSPIFNQAYASILMSGTLMPLALFRDTLGVCRAVEHAYPNPFPQHHRKVFVVPETTTKFAQRNDAMYKEIADSCARIISSVPGNCALFFPSYDLCWKVVPLLLCKKKIFAEKSGMTPDQKKNLLASFVHDGGVLCGVAAASFAEGVDMPGVLKAVVVVGLPLARPDIRTAALITYYDKKFQAGWDYGYTLPAMIKCLQAAGRCIRSEKDNGVIVFLDRRYIQSRYYQCIPPDWEPEVTRNYAEKIKAFFMAR